MHISKYVWLKHLGMDRGKLETLDKMEKDETFKNQHGEL